MEKRDIGVLPVADKDRLVGMITDRVSSSPPPGKAPTVTAEAKAWIQRPGLP
jgi:hypothetical protein